MVSMPIVRGSVCNIYLLPRNTTNHYLIFHFDRLWLVKHRIVASWNYCFQYYGSKHVDHSLVSDWKKYMVFLFGELLENTLWKFSSGATAWLFLFISSLTRYRVSRNGLPWIPFLSHSSHRADLIDVRWPTEHSGVKHWTDFGVLIYNYLRINCIGVFLIWIVPSVLSKCITYSQQNLFVLSNFLLSLFGFQFWADNRL